MTPQDEQERQRLEALERMRRAMAAVDLDPQQTSDDIVRNDGQDQRLRDEVPPHHGGQ